MELEAIAERLEQYGGLLREIKDHLARLNGRLGVVENWQAGTDPVLESLVERVNDNCDKVDNHQTYIDQQKGGSSMMLQIGAGIISVLTLLGMAVKLIFFHS